MKLRKTDLGRLRKRYARYRLFFFSAFFVFILTLILEMIFFGAGGERVFFSQTSSEEIFPKIFTADALWILFMFLSGVTLYAPFLHFLFAALRGFLSGFVLSALARSGCGVIFFLFSLLFLVFSAWLFFVYSSFCTSVALRLFTDQPLKSYREEEKRMFGGSLFNSTFFCNVINFRFLSLYAAFFLLTLLLSGTLSYVFSFSHSLI